MKSIVHNLDRGYFPELAPVIPVLGFASEHALENAIFDPSNEIYTIVYLSRNTVVVKYSISIRFQRKKNLLLMLYFLRFKRYFLLHCFRVYFDEKKHKTEKLLVVI